VRIEPLFGEPDGAFAPRRRSFWSGFGCHAI